MGRRRCCCDQQGGIDFTSYSISSVSLSGTGGGTATCGCCGGDLVPDTLTATISGLSGIPAGCPASGLCANLNGTYYLTFEYSIPGLCRWRVNFSTITCGSVSTSALLLDLYCSGGAVYIYLKFESTTNSFPWWWDGAFYPPNKMCCSSGISSFSLTPVWPTGSTGLICSNFGAGVSAVINKPAC